MSDGAPTLQAARMAQTRHELSEVAMELFATRGFAETTVEEIARAAGTSVRTFHRYFPTKASSVAPVLDDGWRGYLDDVAAEPADETLLDRLVVALDAATGGAHGGRHQAFLPTLLSSPELRPIWLAVNDRCAQALTPLIAGHLGLQPDEPRAQFVALCIVDANRIAMQEWVSNTAVSPGVTLRRCLSDIAGALFTP